jgi:hypothetical protein
MTEDNRAQMVGSGYLIVGVSWHPVLGRVIEQPNRLTHARGKSPRLEFHDRRLFDIPWTCYQRLLTYAYAIAIIIRNPCVRY